MLAGIQIAKSTDADAATMDFDKTKSVERPWDWTPLALTPLYIDGVPVYCVSAYDNVEPGAQYSAPTAIPGQVVDFSGVASPTSLQKYALVSYVLNGMSDQDIRILYGDDTSTASQMISLRRGLDHMTKQRLIWYVSDNDPLTDVVPYRDAAYLVGSGYAVAPQSYVDAHNARVRSARPLTNLIDTALRALNDGRLMYEGGLNAYYGPQLATATTGARVIWADAYIKVNKSMIQVNGVDNNRWNFGGIKVGVYEDRGGNQLHATITIDGNGNSQPVKIKPNKDYYLYELDINNRPIMSSEQKINQQPMTGGKFEGQGGYGYALRIAAGQHTTADTAKVVGLENVPEIVNAKFKKVSNSTIDGQDNPQYSIAGAEYTLYASADDARAGRNGLQTVRVNADGIGEFENLTRNVYYAKETKAPELSTAAGNKKSHVLDDTVHTLDLRHGGTRDANVSTDATGVNNPVHEFRYSEVYRSTERVPEDRPQFDLRKVDKDTLRNLPQGFGNFANAEYKVEFFLPEVLGNAAFRNMKFAATYKTDDQGRINIYDKSSVVRGSVIEQDEFDDTYLQYERNNNWPVYDMRITEVNAPSGYHVSEEVKEIKATLTGDANIRQNNQQDSLNEDDLELTLFKRQKVENEWQTNETEYIPGAKFLIENKTTGQRAEAIVDGQGKLKFNGLSEGNYELKEIEVPKGYQLNKQVIRFTVNKNAKISNVSRSIETDDDGNFRFEWAEGRVSPNTNVKEDIDILVDNIPTRAIAKVVKVNEKNEPLAGATFTLTRLDDDGNPRTDEQPVEVTTNDQGVADFTGLVIGDYYTIEETKAPVGYKLPREKQVIKFRAESIPVKDSFAVTYEFSQLDQYDLSNRHVVKKNGKLTTAANSTSVTTKENTVNGMSFTVDGNEQMHLQFNQVNHTWKKLPATGSNFAMIGGVVSMTLVFSGAVAYGLKRKLS